MFRSFKRRTRSDAREAFDWPEWHQTRRVVEAGIAGDAEQFSTELHALDRMFPLSRRAGAYLMYAIRYQVVKRLDRRPGTDDLTHLAEQILAPFNELVNSDLSTLDEALQVIFELTEASTSTRGARMIVIGSALLSVLTKEPADLGEIEVHLVPWYNSNGEEFQALNRSGTLPI